MTTKSTTEFDEFAGNYDKLLKNSIAASGYEPSFFDEHKIKTVFYDFNKGQGIIRQELNILNFGCGIGKSEKHINHYFESCNIHSVDVSEESIKVAIENNRQYVNVCFKTFSNVEELQFNVKFDIIFVANVFHHIPEDLHHVTLTHLRSLLSPGGYLYVFEHNPKNPLTRKVFETCEFDVGCKMIRPDFFIKMCKEAGYTSIKRHYVLFFPKALSFLSFGEKYLKWCSYGAQYYIKAR